MSRFASAGSRAHEGNNPQRSIAAWRLPEFSRITGANCSGETLYLGSKSNPSKLTPKCAPSLDTGP